MKKLIQKMFAKFGYEIHSLSIHRSHFLRKLRLIEDLKIDMLIDGGANEGQYGSQVREMGYKGKIISIEPLKTQFYYLQKKSITDRNWTVLNCALGDMDGTTEINVSDVSQVSSLLKATGNATTASWKTQKKEVVKLVKLSSVIKQEGQSCQNIYLKLDVQGSEKKAIDGLENNFARIAAIELELSTIPLYEGETLFPEMVALLSEKDFSVFSVEPVVVDHESGRILQLEVLMRKESKRI